MKRHLKRRHVHNGYKLQVPRHCKRTCTNTCLLLSSPIHGTTLHEAARLVELQGGLVLSVGESMYGCVRKALAACLRDEIIVRPFRGLRAALREWIG